MAALASPKHEKFCRLIASGVSVAEAHERAGFAPNPQNAQTLKRRDYIARRLSELQEGAARRAEISGKKILEEMALIAFHNPADYLHFNDDGTAELDLVALDRDHCAAISEMTCVTTFDRNGGKRTRISIKLLDKKGALESLGRHYGLWTEKLEIGRPGDFSNVASTDELLEKLRAELGETDAVEFMRLVQQESPRALTGVAIEQKEAPNEGA